MAPQPEVVDLTSEDTDSSLEEWLAKNFPETDNEEDFDFGDC